MGYWIIDGKQMTNAEYEDHQRQQIEAREQVRREATALMGKLGQTYEALTRLLEQNPEVGRQVTDRTAAEEEIYRKLRRSLEHADMAPRCRWVRQDGTACGSPQMRKHIYCYAHKQMMEARALALRLPALEDANAIQIGIMRIQKSLIDDTITTKKAGLLLYSMQLALTNVGQTTFGQAKDEELVTDLMDEEEALSQKAVSSQHSAFSQNENLSTAEPPQHAKTARAGGPGDAEHAEESQTLPLMNADQTDRTDWRGLPRINADDRGLEPAEVPEVVTMRMGDRTPGTAGWGQTHAKMG